MSAHHTRLRGVVTLAVLCGASPTTLARSGVSGSETAEVRGKTEIAQILVESRHADYGALALPERLSSLGEEALPTLFDTLAAGAFDVRVGERGNASHDLLPGERLALLSALGLCPWERVLAFLAERLLEGPSDGARVAALDLMGTFGTVGAVADVVAWSQPESEKQRASHEVKQALAHNLTTLLQRFPRATPGLPALYGKSNHSLIPSILESLRSNPSEPSLQAMVGCLGRVGAADPFVLAEIAQVGPSVRRPVEQRLRDKVRAYLAPHRPRASQLEAVVAAQNLDDCDAVPDLIELLRSDDVVLRDRAHGVLKSLTSQHLPADWNRWDEWHADSTEWWHHEAPEMLAAARSGAPAQASRAILELSKRVVYRHELAEPLARALNRSERDLVVLTCAALGHLGSPLAVPDLLTALSHRDVEVRSAAFQALRRITHQDHGEEPSAWKAAGW